MNARAQPETGFSLIEVTLALGVAGFCLIAVFGLVPVASKTQQAAVQQTTANEIMATILGDLRADVRLPKGQQSKTQEGVQGLGLHGNWANVATPDTLYFTNTGTQTGSANQSPAPANAAFRAKITYLYPPNASTSVADIRVSWPAQIDPATGVPAGSVETFIAVNR